MLGWENIYVWNQETFGSDGTLGRSDTREVVLKRDLRAALVLRAKSTIWSRVPFGIQTPVRVPQAFFRATCPAISPART